MAFQDQRCYRTGQPLRVSFQIGEHLFAGMDGAQGDSSGNRWEDSAAEPCCKSGGASPARAVMSAAAQDLSPNAIAATMPPRWQLTMLCALVDTPCKSDSRNEAGARAP